MNAPTAGGAAARVQNPFGNNSCRSAMYLISSTIADVNTELNGDGSIDMKDASLIVRYSTGLDVVLIKKQKRSA